MEARARVVLYRCRARGLEGGHGASRVQSTTVAARVGISLAGERSYTGRWRDARHFWVLQSGEYALDSREHGRGSVRAYLSLANFVLASLIH